MSKLKNIIPFEYAICGFANTEKDKLVSYNIINVNYPQEWLRVYEQKGYPYIDPVVRENFTTFNLQYWKDTYKKYNPPRNFLMEAEDFNLKSGYTNGTRNRNGTRDSIFTIAGRSLERREYYEIVLDTLTPHFHNAMARILRKSAKAKLHITHREKEVLNWLKEGKSSWDISIILNISENTVNFHIKNIMEKLDATNRAQAVAAAIENDLIQLC
ncbi:MAG: autoinducer binding domain-containing protein [Nitrospiraceae bacterium]|nr:autoinducer binding domain-containing protein [Nitrospiraceae bacterium]